MCGGCAKAIWPKDVSFRGNGANDTLLCGPICIKGLSGQGEGSVLCAIRVLDTWWYKGAKVYVLEKKWVNRLDDIRNFVTTKIRD